MICRFIEDEPIKYNISMESYYFYESDDIVTEGIASKIGINIKAFFSSAIEWFRRLISNLINAIKKIFGIQTKPKELVIRGKEKIEPVLRITRNSHQLDYLIKEIDNLLNLIPSVMRRSASIDDLNEDMQLYMNHANEYFQKFKTVDNIPEEYIINFSNTEKEVNKLLSSFKKVYQKVSTTSPNFDINKDGPYSKLYIKINKYIVSLVGQINTLLLVALKVISPLKENEKSNNASNLLNSKVIQTIDGYKVISAETKRFPFTKATSSKELADKYGKIFIVVDEAIFNLCTSKTKRFTLIHEINHCKQLDSGEDEKLSPMQREVSSDLYAARKMNLKYNDVKKIFNELTDVAVKVGQPRAHIATQFNGRLSQLAKEI